MGTNARRYDIRDGNMTGDTIYRDVNWWQAIGYTVLGTDGRRYEIQRWETMADDTINRDLN